MSRLRCITFSITLLSGLSCFAQEQTQEQTAGKLSPKELAIPASPVFDLMGVTPSLVNRTSDIKDFKVDWSFKSWKLNPNLAIQSQPLWEIFYNRKDLSRYQQASPFMRRLASLDVSVGSVQDEFNDRRIGFAIKMGVYREKDPLMARSLYEDLHVQFTEEKTALETQLKELMIQLDTTSQVLQRPGLRSQINSVEEQLLSLRSRRQAEINTRAAIYAAENWNAASLDIAFGKVYTYQTDSAGSLGKLRLNRNTGWGAWLNGGFGIGKKMLVTGLVRTTFYEEQLNFLLRDLDTFEETEQQAVASTMLYTAGLNFRYGGPIYNFFAEIFYEKKSTSTAGAALNKVFSPDPNTEVVGSSVNWSPVLPTTLTIGGDWRISRNVIINYGMRFSFDQNWTFRTFTPVASIACLMR
jgi:hypothetical protein